MIREKNKFFILIIAIMALNIASITFSMQKLVEKHEQDKQELEGKKLVIDDSFIEEKAFIKAQVGEVIEEVKGRVKSEKFYNDLCERLVIRKIISVDVYEIIKKVENRVKREGFKEELLSKLKSYTLESKPLINEVKQQDLSYVKCRVKTDGTTVFRPEVKAPDENESKIYFNRLRANYYRLNGRWQKRCEAIDLIFKEIRIKSENDLKKYKKMSIKEFDKIASEELLKKNIKCYLVNMFKDFDSVYSKYNVTNNFFKKASMNYYNEYKINRNKRGLMLKGLYFSGSICCWMEYIYQEICKFNCSGVGKDNEYNMVITFEDFGRPVVYFVLAKDLFSK